MKKALIFGICGQDAAYMSQLLLDKGYEVHGVGRSVTHERMWRLDDLGITDKINISSGDITDASYLVQLFSDLHNNHKRFLISGHIYNTSCRHIVISAS